ncbi:polyprenyl synthetase family protein [Candidatus Micrarchaeota archaeon]|nr:polyprenyl synthetase family protein [Candidatus Micrarchaeota archaeon]
MNADEYIRSRMGVIEKEMYANIPAEPKEVYGMLGEFISRGGKRIRPVLVLASCSACGGKEESALPFAVAIELFHNFTLIHDDIEDASPMRRGKPTIHTQYGIPIAINSGDALYSIVWNALVRKVEPQKLRGGGIIMIDAFRRVAEGQGIELNWYRENRFDVGEKEYLRMAGGKTAALIGASCELGAYSAGAGKEEQAALKGFGEKIGLAFQIKDDVLNLTADPAKYRKKIGEDIDEGKRSLITIHLIANTPESVRKKVVALLGKKKKSAKDIGDAIALAKEYGSIKYASDYAERLVREAKASLGALGKAEGRELMQSLGDYIVERER